MALKHKCYNTSKAEVQYISKRGIWLLVDKQEFFLPFAKYKWFRDATVNQIYNLEFYHSRHLHWPQLDIDIEIDSLKYPESYPLEYGGK